MEFSFKGELIAVFDHYMAMDSILHGNIVIYLGDPMSTEIRTMAGILVGSVLLPNIDAMQALANDDSFRFIHSYQYQLQTDPYASDMIYSIIGALYKGKTVVFYAPSDCLDLGFLDVLFEFFENNYGLQIQKDIFHKFKFNPSFIPVYLKILYEYNLIRLEEFVAYIPDALIGDDHAMMLILQYMGMEISAYNMKYVRDWHNSIKGSGKLLKPVINFIM